SPSARWHLSWTLRPGSPAGGNITMLSLPVTEEQRSRGQVLIDPSFSSEGPAVTQRHHLEAASRTVNPLPTLRWQGSVARDGRCGRHITPCEMPVNVSPATVMGPLFGVFCHAHGTTRLPVMGPPGAPAWGS